MKLPPGKKGRDVRGLRWQKRRHFVKLGGLVSRKGFVLDKHSLFCFEGVNGSLEDILFRGRLLHFHKAVLLVLSFFTSF